MREPKKRARTILLWLSLALYLVACLTPALVFKQAGSPEEPMPGWNVLAVGWLGAFINQFGWYANLFWFTGLICGFFKFFTFGKVAAGIGLIVSAISVSMLFSQDVPANEGGVGPPLKLVSLGVGCWLWFFCQVLVFAGNFGRKAPADGVADNNEVQSHRN